MNWGGKSMLEQFQHMHSDNFQINGPIPREKANKIAFLLNIGNSDLISLNSVLNYD
jgi:hypothetical protein